MVDKHAWHYCETRQAVTADAWLHELQLWAKWWASLPAGCLAILQRADR